MGNNLSDNSVRDKYGYKKDNSVARTEGKKWSQATGGDVW